MCYEWVAMKDHFWMSLFNCRDSLSHSAEFALEKSFQKNYSWKSYFQFEDSLSSQVTETIFILPLFQKRDFVSSVPNFPGSFTKYKLDLRTLAKLFFKVIFQLQTVSPSQSIKVTDKSLFHNCVEKEPGFRVFQILQHVSQNACKICTHWPNCSWKSYSDCK